MTETTMPRTPKMALAATTVTTQRTEYATNPSSTRVSTEVLRISVERL